MSEYTQQAIEFLVRNGLEFRAVVVGSDCPQFCEDAKAERDMDKTDTYPRKTHIHGKHYRCTISGKDRGHISFDFWNSYADEEYNALRLNPDGASWETLKRIFGKDSFNDKAYGFIFRVKTKPRAIQAYDLLACIQKNDAGTFHDFCGEFGYDEDSRSAEQVYIAVCKEYQKVCKFFTDVEIEQLQEIQ